MHSLLFIVHDNNISKTNIIIHQCPQSHPQAYAPCTGMEGQEISCESRLQHNPGHLPISTYKRSVNSSSVLLIYLTMGKRCVLMCHVVSTGHHDCSQTEHIPKFVSTTGILTTLSTAHIDNSSQRDTKRGSEYNATISIA